MGSQPTTVLCNDTVRRFKSIVHGLTTVNAAKTRTQQKTLQEGFVADKCAAHSQSLAVISITWCVDKRTRQSYKWGSASRTQRPPS